MNRVRVHAPARRDSAIQRRTFVGCIGASLLSVAFATVAQPSKAPRIGFVRTTRPPRAYIDAFERGLVDKGYTPGRSILIEYRFGDGTIAEVTRLARELVNLNVDLIVAGGGQATRAAQSATTTIPIVMSAASDPVGTGLVASLARPGGNTTGTSIVSWELFAKRLELLRQVLPNASRVAVIINPTNPAPANGWNDALATARTLGVNLQRIDVGSAADFQQAFETMRKDRAEAFIVVQSNIFETPPYPIQKLAIDYRIPGMYGLRTSADAGGLISYGPNVRDLYAYAAVFVDKILRGAKPANIPVEQPTKIELVVNIKTAKALGLTIPQAVLLRADALIE